MNKYIRNLARFLIKYLPNRLSQRSPRPYRLRKVLISGYTGLGNFLLVTPIIKKIEELYPGCKIDIITGTSYGVESLVKDLYRTLLLEEKNSLLKKLIFFLKLRKKKYDAIIGAPVFLRVGSLIAGIPIRVGHVTENLSGGYFLSVKVPLKLRKIRSEIDVNYDLLETLYGKALERNYETYVANDYRDEVLKLNNLVRNKYICIQIAAANGQPTPKVWLESNFRDLIKKLLKHFRNIKIVALGDKGDSIIVNRVCGQIAQENLVNLSGKVPLAETINLIYYSRLLVCHDSGLMHIGNALKKEVIAIYGPSDPDYYALRLPTFHVIRKKMKCSPCSGHFLGYPSEEDALKNCPYPVRACMKNITVDEVFHEISTRLNNK